MGLQRASSRAVEAAEVAKFALVRTKQSAGMISEDSTLEELVEAAALGKVEAENANQAAKSAQSAAATTKDIEEVALFNNKASIKVVKVATVAAEEAIEASKLAADLAFTLLAKLASAEALEAAKQGKWSEQRVLEAVRKVNTGEVTLEEVEEAVCLAETAADETDISV